MGLADILPWGRKADPAEHHVAGFGGHHIGWLGSLCLVCNNIIGPGLFQLPGLIQQAGWLPTIVAILLVAVWTTQSALYLAKTMAMFAGNGSFAKRLEFTKTTHHLLPRWGYMASVITLSVVFFSQNVANILMTSQAMDATLLDMFGKTCALDWTRLSFTCVAQQAGSAPQDSLFGSSYVITTGYVIVLVVCIPLGILNLDDNIGIQIGGMALTVVCIVVWLANFCALGLDWSFAPAFSTNRDDYLQLLPTVLFNYGFVATIPSWLNEKSPDVHVTRTVIGAQVLATLQFLVLAVFGAFSISAVGSTSIVAVIDQDGNPGIWHASRIMTYIFPIANILTSIPVFSIIVRYNLLQFQGVHMPVWLANLFAVVLPWVVALPFYPGDSMNDVITWSSAVLFVHMNLIQPLWVYLESARRQAAGLPQIRVTDDGDPLDKLDNHAHRGGAGGGLNQLLLDEEDARDPLMRDAAGSPVGIELLAEPRSGGSRAPPLSSINAGGRALQASRPGFSLNYSAGVSGAPVVDDTFGFREPPSAEHEDDGGAAADGIRVLPACCGGRRSEYGYAYGLFVLSFVLAFAAVALQVVQTVNPNL